MEGLASLILYLCAINCEGDGSGVNSVAGLRLNVGELMPLNCRENHGRKRGSEEGDECSLPWWSGDMDKGEARARNDNINHKILLVARVTCMHPEAVVSILIFF